MAESFRNSSQVGRPEYVRAGLRKRGVSVKLRLRWDRSLTVETRRIIHDAATVGPSLIDMGRWRAGAPASHDRPHCLAVEIIALRQVLDGDESHGSLLAPNYRRSAPRGGSVRRGNGSPSQVTVPAGRSSMRLSVASRPTDSLRTVARHPSDHEPPAALRKSSKRKLFKLFQSLGVSHRGRNAAWHGACNISPSTGSNVNPTPHLYHFRRN